MTDLYNAESNVDSTNSAPVQQPPAPQFQLPDSVAGLVGPGKKYASVEVALAALPNAQDHIARLEQDNKTLRESVNRGQSVDEVYATVKDLLMQEQAKVGSVGLDEASVARLVDSRISATREQEIAQANETRFKEAMKSVFGDKDAETFNAKAAELGLTTQELSIMARKSPVAALRLVGATEKPNASRPVQSDVNTDALARRQPNEAPRKNVMLGGSSADVLAAWRAAAPTNT